MGAKSSLKTAIFRLENVIEQKRTITFSEFIYLIGNDAHSIILICLTVPFLQPIPLPGLSTPVGIWIGITGIHMAFRKKLWIPKFLGKKNLSLKLVKIIHKSASKTSSFLHKNDWLLTTILPRKIKSLFRFQGLSIFMAAIVFSLPLPLPGSNTLPAYCILLHSLSILFHAEILGILGILFLILSVAYPTLAFLSVERFFS